jgi:hypothetical protein
VVGARGVAGRGANALILLADQARAIQRLVSRISPELAAHPLVHALGQGFGEAIGQGLQHDAAIVVVSGFELRDALIDADSGGHRKRTHVVGAAALQRRDEIGQAQLRLVLRLRLLLT